MQSHQLFLALLLAGTTSASYGVPLRRRDNVTTPAIDPVPDVDYEDVLVEINARPNTTVLKRYESNVFCGIAVEAVSESAESLQASEKVAQAWQSHLIKLMPTIGFAPGNGVDPNNYSVHAMTGVDRLHDQGIFGKGVKVAIVDTGVDYNHTALGRGFGSGFKVQGGHDYLGNTYYPEEAVKPDADPLDTDGHGTHVAGIVAGNNDWFKGVAPEASILAYKVFGLGPYTDDSIVIEAFLQAYEDGADIITASIGDYSNWATNPWAIVASRLVDEGIVVTIAAGNDGEQGPFRGSTGASGYNVLAVASVDPSDIVAIPIIATFSAGNGTETHELAYRPGSVMFPFDMNKMPVYALTLNTTVTDDACLPLPEDTPDLSGTVVLVRQSLDCEDWQQADNVAPFNPAGIIFYHNLDVEYLDPFSHNEFPVGIVTDEAGALIVKTLASGGNVTLDFAEVDKYVVMPYQWGGTGSFYTTWGGLWDLTLKPDIAAPGSSILSTYLGNSWAELSGTSMATPYIAGIAALYIGKFGGRQQHGKDFAKTLHARILSSGSSMAWPGNTFDSGSHLASPSQVGNGLVNAWKVLEYDTQLSFTKFSLNDTLHFSRYQGVEITNTGDKDIQYTWGVEAAGGYDAMCIEGGDCWAPEMRWINQLQLYELKPEVIFPAGGAFKVKPGQTKRAEFIFKLPSLPAGHKTAELPVYSGKIMIYGSNGEQLSVPYYGVLADVKKEIRAHGVFWTGIGLWPQLFFPTIYGPIQTVYDKPYWNFETNNMEPDWPMLQLANIWGSQELRWDVFESNWPERKWQYPLVEGKNGYIGTATYWRGSRAGVFDSTKDDPNDILAFPSMYLNRQYTHVYIWLGQLTNGSMLQPGNYTMRIAALLPFGERERSDNWDVMDLPQIQIKPKTISK